MLLLILFFLILAHGIKISHFVLPGAKIEQLYIKLDKKLIVEIGAIDLETHRQGRDTITELEDAARMLALFPSFFEKVQIDDITIDDEHAQLLFYKNLFYLTTDRLQLATALQYDERSNRILATIHTFYLLKAKTTLSGQFIYDLRQNVWYGQGGYDGLNLTGRFKVEKRAHRLSFAIDSNETDSIKPLIDYLDPPKKIKVWIYPNIPAQRYRLHFLKGTLVFDRKGHIDWTKSQIEGHATAWNAKIHFHPKLPPISTPRIDILYRDNTLAFDIQRPVYQGKKLAGSFVKIRHLFKHGTTTLDAHIVLTSRFDATIQKTLRAYHIPVPFIQSRGVMHAVSDLSIRLGDGKITRYSGDYRIAQGVLLFDDTIPIPVEKLHVTAKDSLFKILSAHIHLPPYLNASLTGTLNLAKKKGHFRPIVHTLTYRYHDIPLFKMRKKPLRVDLDFTQGVRFKVPLLELSLAYRPGGKMRVEAADLTRLRPFLLGPAAKLKSGDLRLDYHAKAATIAANVIYDNDVLYQHHKPLTRFSITAIARDKGYEASINGRAKITGKEDLTTINYRQVDVHVPRLLHLLRPFFTSKRDKKHTVLLHIDAQESTLYTDHVYLPCRSYQLKMTSGRHLSILFESKHESGTIQGVLYDDRIKAVGKHLPDSVIHGIPALKDLFGGYFDFEAAGRLDDLNGTIYAYDTLWAQSPFYNNVLAALNTIPAILSLKNPGFNQRGFKIKSAAIRYHYKNPRFTFQNIVIHGESADIYGKGHIDFDDRDIDIKMRIHFLETVASLMHKIPVAGYILFGKDGTLSVGLEVHGSLEDPIVKTSAVHDIVTAPINILKRAFTFPFHLFHQ